MELTKEETDRLNELKKEGVIKKYNIEKVLKLREDGLSIRQIAFVLDTNRQRIWRVFKKVKDGNK